MPHYSAFQRNAFQRNAFQIVDNNPVVPVVSVPPLLGGGGHRTQDVQTMRMEYLRERHLRDLERERKAQEEIDALKFQEDELQQKVVVLAEARGKVAKKQVKDTQLEISLLLIKIAEQQILLEEIKVQQILYRKHIMALVIMMASPLSITH